MIILLIVNKNVLELIWNDIVVDSFLDFTALNSRFVSTRSLYQIFC